MQNREVTLKQITFAASTMIIGTSILTKQVYTYMKYEAWIAVVAGFILCLLIFGIYTVLARKFPGLSLIEINETVFGSIPGKIVSALYIYFFLTIACLNVDVMGSFVKGYILPNTPMVLIMLLFVLVCAWAVRKGPYNLMKNSVLLTVVSFVILVTITSLLIPDVDFKRLLPIFSLPPVNYAVGTHSIALIPMCDPFFMLMFLPYVKNANDFGKALVHGLMIGVAFMLVLIIRDPAVLGPDIVIFSLPTLISIRMIDVGDILTRIDIIYFVIITMLIFYKVSLLLFISVSATQRLLKRPSYSFLVNIMGALLILYALTVFKSASEHIEWLVNGAAHIQHTFFIVGLPLLTLIVALARRLGNAGQNGTAGREDAGRRTG